MHLETWVHRRSDGASKEMRTSSFRACHEVALDGRLRQRTPMAQTRPNNSSSKSAAASKGASSKSSAKKETKPAKPSHKAADVKPAAKLPPPPAKSAPAAKPAAAAKAPAVAAKAAAPVVKSAKAPEPPPKDAKAKVAKAEEAAKAAPTAAPPPRKPSHDEDAGRPSTPGMSKDQLERFRRLLLDKRDDIIRKAKQTLDEDMTLDANDLPDEMDLASSEYLQSFTFRLRGREKSFLDKINKALERLDGGNFGVCEECGEEISVKRLEARPETTLCIRCKEDQERAEKDYG